MRFTFRDHRFIHLTLIRSLHTFDCLIVEAEFSSCKSLGLQDSLLISIFTFSDDKSLTSSVMMQGVRISLVSTLRSRGMMVVGAKEFGWRRVPRRMMGGYIEDAQIAMLGLELYQDIHGVGTIPPTTFIIPHEDHGWPIHLWGYALGVGVETHITKHLTGKPLITKSTN